MDDFGDRFEAFLRIGALLAAGMVAEDDLEQREIAAEHMAFIKHGEIEKPANSEARHAAETYTRAAFNRIQANRKKPPSPPAKR